MPPAIRKGVMASSSTSIARITVVIGSIVERIEAFVGPTRSRPAKNVMIARTVEIIATARLIQQKSKLVL